jgi:hypothetical protein
VAVAEVVDNAFYSEAGGSDEAFHVGGVVHAAVAVGDGGEVEACKSEEELKSIYFAYKAQFGTDQRFLDALSKRKAQVKAA